MKITASKVTVGEITLTVGTYVKYGSQNAVVTEVYDLTNGLGSLSHLSESYGPFVDLRFADGSTVSQVVPGLDPRFGGLV